MSHTIPSQRPTSPRTIGTTHPDAAPGERITVAQLIDPDPGDDGICLWLDGHRDGMAYLDATARRELAAALVAGLI